VVPQLALGGYHLGMHTQEAPARALVEAALEEGVRFFDSAEQYQRNDDSRSERWLGAALADVRDEVFLMTKTWDPDERSGATAREHLARSLERLRTDRLDLWQLHAIKSPEDVDRAFAPGGAMEAILEAQAQGLTRFVGVTGHADPAAHLRALHHFDQGLRFDTVQMPMNPVDAHQRSFTRQVLPELRVRGIGVIAMKTAAAGSLPQRGVARVDECLRWVASLPADVLVSGMESLAHLRANAAALRRGPLPEEQGAALLARVAPHVDPGLESYKAG
jgi:aryl-alcohol dehydrogenase-like predicted oxidoreductase